MLNFNPPKGFDIITVSIFWGKFKSKAASSSRPLYSNGYLKLKDSDRIMGDVAYV